MAGGRRSQWVWPGIFCEAEALHKGKHQEMLDGLPDKIGLYIS